ncbi:dynactin 1 [Entomortierella parvispora]|uniref:Dynactin 1 n=1 Tax=Entomortierella parvispora TaxID=205924 RepID=A0A9P3LTQ0_9FUNG|nr:dynactin 1 [Entomortierella parvispora]
MADSSGTLPIDIDLGTRVEVGGNLGYVRHAGTTSFASGRWVGIELDLPRGKNSGVVNDRRYFDCKPDHGVFVRPSQVRIVQDGTTQAESTRRITRPASGIASRSSTSLASRQSLPAGRPSSTRATAPGTASSPSSAASRLSRPPVRRTVDHAPESPARRTRVAPQAQRDEDHHVANERSGSSTPTSSSGIQQHQQQHHQQQQHQRDVSLTPEENEEMLAQERQLQLELEQEEEALAQDQLQREQQQGFAPLSASSSSAGLSANMGPAHRMEAMVPVKEYDELRIKLRILETKRAEDREKLREAEKVKEESEQFLSHRTKLQAKLAEFQQEVREAKRSAKEAVAERDLFESKYNDLADSMEVAVLDKEMAEEKAENLQHEVNMLKEKVDEMHVDLDVLQHDDGNAGNPSVSQVQLERQIERLREALFKLREITNEEKAEMNSKLKNLEKEASLMQEVQAQNERLKECLDIAEGQIEDLKQRLDDAVDAEDTIEQLSEKNINLSEKIEEMQSAIDDLEALKELNDELEENHSETEKQLQAEITIKDSQLRDQLRKIETLEENIGDYENTILKFRELVAHLQGELEQLRQREVTGGTGGHSQEMLSLLMQLEKTAMKAQAKAIDLELRKLDASQATDNLMLVQPFLPDGFFRTENDSIQCLLLFKRLSFKAELMNKHLEQQHSLSEKMSQGVVPLELVPICEVRQKLTWFGDLAKRFVSYIEGCPVDVFAKMGQVYHDLLGTERRLDTWVGLLRKEELKESDCIVDLQRAIAQMDHLTETYLINTKLDLVDRYQGAVHALELNFDRVSVNLSAVVTMFKSSEDGVRLTDTDEIQFQLIQAVKNLGVQAKTGKSTTRKILRRMDELASQASVVKPELFSQYRNACVLSTKLGEFTHEITKHLSLYVRARREGSKTESLHQTIYSVTDQYLGISESGMWDGCRKMLNGLLQDITALAESIMESDIAVKVTKPDKVWIKRAKEMKAEVIVNTDAEQKAQSLQDQVLKLVKEAKLKDEALKESGLRIDHLEKRVENFKKKTEQISILDIDVEKAKKQEREYDELISSLQADMAKLEAENAQLRRHPKKPDRPGIIPVPKRISHPGHHHTGAGHTQEDASAGQDGADLVLPRELLVQIESLRSALRYLRSENSLLRTRAAMQDLGVSADISELRGGPLARRNLEGDEEEEKKEGSATTLESSHADSQKRSPAADSELKAVALETRRLMKDARVICASPKVVDLTKHSASGLAAARAAMTEESTSTTTPRRHWQARQSKPEWHYHTQQAALNTIQQRSNELKDRLAKVTRNSTPVQSAPKLKKLSLLETPIARVRFPGGMSGLVGSPDSQQHQAATARKDLAVYLRSSAEFEAMHQLFVR